MFGSNAQSCCAFPSHSKWQSRHRTSPFLAEMRRHELYIENYCTSRVILHEAQPSAIFLYECNNFRYTTKYKSHFCFISYLGERTKVKKKIDLKIKSSLLPRNLHAHDVNLPPQCWCWSGGRFSWSSPSRNILKLPIVLLSVILVVNRCILPLYIDKYTTANSFVLSPRYDIIKII